MSEEKPPETPEVETPVEAAEYKKVKAEVNTLTDKVKAKEDELASKEEKINQLTEENKTKTGRTYEKARSENAKKPFWQVRPGALDVDFNKLKEATDCLDVIEIIHGVEYPLITEMDKGEFNAFLLDMDFMLKQILLLKEIGIELEAN